MATDKEISKKKKISPFNQGINKISSPIINTGHTNTEFITIKHQSTRKEGKAYDGNSNFPKKQPYSFAYEQEDRSEDISPLFNSTSQESLKDSRRESVDSGVYSLFESSSISDSNESLVSIESKDSGFTENLKDEENKLEMSTFKGPFQQNIPFIPKEYKIEAIKDSNVTDKKIAEHNFATIRKTGTRNKPIKVAIPVVPTLKPKVSDANIQKSIGLVEEKKASVEDLKVLDDVSKVNGELQRKEQLLSQIEQFVPKVNISARKTTKAKVKYGNLDMLKITAVQLDLKIKATDSLLKNKPLMKMDNNNKSEILLITKKDIPLLKKLKHDLKKNLTEISKQLIQEKKRISIYDKQEQKSLQNKILKQDIDKIKNAISAAKSNVNMKERYSFLLHTLGEWQTRLSKNTNAHPDLKEAIKELRREKLEAQTNIWAIRPTEITKNYLPESKISLTFTEKQDIYKHKRDAAKKLLDSDLDSVRSEDKEILKELYKHYTKLAKSSENKPKEKSNLERKFSKEFGPAYKQARQDLEKELITKVSNIHLTEDKESKVPETKMLEASIRQLTVDTVNR